MKYNEIKINNSGKASFNAEKLRKTSFRFVAINN
jgi:hypothetical protein